MEKPKFQPPCKICTPSILKIKLYPCNYLMDIYTCATFYCNSFKGRLPQICEILRFCDFLLYCPVLSWLYFFSRTRTQVAPLDGF